MKGFYENNKFPSVIARGLSKGGWGYLDPFPSICSVNSSAVLLSGGVRLRQGPAGVKPYDETNENMSEVRSGLTNLFLRRSDSGIVIRIEAKPYEKQEHQRVFDHPLKAGGSAMSRAASDDLTKTAN